MESIVLIVDDEKNIREGLAEFLRQEGLNVETSPDGESALKRCRGGADIALVISDLKMPGMDGMELLKALKKETEGIQVIMLTGHGTIRDATEAMRLGAWDFFTKPIEDYDRLSIIVRRVIDNHKRYIRTRRLEEEVAERTRFRSIIGNSAAIRGVLDTVSRVAPARASVLITGESGVGKEMIADMIHHLSPRAEKPLIKVHCAALAESILESELFGHEKGAFTGAVGRRRGKFELAHEGTLFLDEIGEIEQNIQVKLLRVLQEKKFERVGGEDTIEVDIRLIAATNKNLLEEIKKGSFREDLYYRLNVVSVHVPPLRERKDDLPLLINTFVKQFAQENAKVVDGVDEAARARLYNYSWPGNIRELRNCIESAVVMTKGPLVREDDLPPTLRSVSADGFIQIPAGVTLDEAEQIIVARTLTELRGNKNETARQLGISRKTLYRKLTEWGTPDEEINNSGADKESATEKI
ncbi:MAG: sigma-54 dependent transcriptional regulator [Spirochaetaceae bacterium]|jgi:DNA-binding NtrC family response regulator|nr:sigma-54 dependent transcriptional regulator [Spirochaetaceae bacterium]